MSAAMRVMTVLVVLLAVCAAPVAGSGDTLPTAKDILDRADAATGPAPPNYRETIVGTGSLGETKTATYKAGDDVRRTFARGAYHDESGTYHGESWEQDYNGLTVAVLKDPGAAAKDPITTTVTRVSQPFTAYVIAKMNRRAAGTRSYYDATTFLRRRVERVNATGTVVTTYDEFAQFGPQTLPLNWTVSSKESQLTMHYRRLDYVPDGATSADIAQTPTKRALVEFPSDLRAVDLPVKLLDHEVVVRVQIGSQIADFGLDTGAGSVVIDPDFARQVGLPLTNAQSSVVAGRFTAYTATVPELQIGPLRMHDLVVNVAPMPAAHPSGTKIVGLLGFDFLAQLGVTIDYQHGTVRVTPAEEYVPPAGPSTYGFDVRLGSKVPMITVTVGNAVAERVVLDTGGNGELLFFDFFARRYPHAFEQDLGRVDYYGVGGAFAAELFRLHDVKLGPLHFQDFRGARVPGSSYASNMDGVIGNDLLSFFTFDLDYTRGRVYLTPNDAGKKAMHPLR